MISYYYYYRLYLPAVSRKQNFIKSHIISPLLLQEKVRTEPTAVKRWCRRFPNFDSSWKEILHKISKTTSDKKLTEFGYKAFHRILVTNKELKLIKIRNDDVCFQCKSPDSLEHTFLECPRNVQFYQEILSWFNTLNNIGCMFSLSKFLDRWAY